MNEHAGAGDLLRRGADRVLGGAPALIPDWVKQLGDGGDLPNEPGRPDRRPERPEWLLLAFLGGYAVGVLVSRGADWLVSKAEVDANGP